MSNNKSNNFPKGVVFDMDGLMFNTEWVVKYSWDMAGKDMGYESFGDNIYNTLGMNKAARKEYFLEKYGENFDFDGFTEIYREYCLSYLKEKGTPIKPGLFELLEYLKSEGIPMVVATSSNEEFAMSKLKETGCLKYFKRVICGNMVTKSKPDPQIYNIARKELGMDASDVLALEDAPNGIRAALAAGINVIMIPDLLENAPSELEGKLTAKLEDLNKVVEFIKKHK